MKKSNSKQMGAGGGVFWKRAAAVLCAIQVLHYFFIHYSTMFSVRQDLHEWGGAKRPPLQQTGIMHEGLRLKEAGAWRIRDDEADIRRIHNELQLECGHRGIPAGDKHHVDSRKGPTGKVVLLLQNLEEAYSRRQQRASPTFQPPKSRQADGTAVWRDWEFSCFSQCGDDGLLYRIFGILGWGHRRSVEIGYFPHEANSVNLIVNANFTGLLLDGNTAPLVAQSWYASVPDYLAIVHDNHKLPEDEWTFKEPTESDLAASCAPYCLTSCYNINCYKASTMERQPFIKKDLVKVTNIASLIDTPFASLHISLKGAGNLDYFSIDVDGMDYYLLGALLESGYAPRVVATEYAAHMGHQLALTRPYSPTFAAAATSFQYGASLLAFVKLMRRHEYRFIGCVEWNAYFLRLDELKTAELEAAFPEQQLRTCFYQDANSLHTEVVRRRQACQVEWVEVEVDAGKEPREWRHLKLLLLDT